MQLFEYVKAHTQLEDYEVKGIIMSGKVYINNEVCTYYKEKIIKDDIVVIKFDKKKYVTRSGLKLEKGIETFGVEIAGKICIDIGASEGGFTDCLLKKNAEMVYSVDVAYGILDWQLRNNPKVIVLERTNARYLDDSIITEPCDVITSDVSFISIKKVLPNAAKLLKENGVIISLYKPQFELPKQYLKKNGNVENPQYITQSFAETIGYMKSEGVYIRKLVHSPIRGNNGNIEFLFLADKIKENAEILLSNEVENVVNNAFTTLMFHSVL